MKAQGTPLREARVLFFGAGSSAVGVATLIAQLIEKEEHLPFDEAKKVRAAESALPLPPDVCNHTILPSYCIFTMARCCTHEDSVWKVGTANVSAFA